MSQIPWDVAQARKLYELPFMDLVFQAQQVHRAHHDPNAVQISTLLSIKTGACPEDCKYCPQSARYHTGVSREALLKVEEIITAAKRAKEQGATRFCMGAAWRDPKDKDMPYLQEVIHAVKDLGMETCMTLGMLNADKAQQLANAGLDYYNHNLDTSRRYYSEIISTRSYDDRLDTLTHVREAGMKICSGGILGMGEEEDDQLAMLVELANLNPPPESVPINQLVRVQGTPLAQADDLEPFDFIRIIAIARIMMPRSAVRLSAGREQMNEQMQALCFMAGANSIFYGCKLLTTANPEEDRDKQLFNKLGINRSVVHDPAPKATPEQAPIGMYYPQTAL
ncbi:biotin synthase BioB [Suttonella sp. R2A3]|uniref:biotin synthase BioB n=1 Tax=Suttonella sp. R2A3 TaxID=2908648 RepID=UPI001F17A14F|nr:biotin synthase BioB [Suttonella sp. R2A3]UJF24038.1 biotin synthase BioB [Suttonella sp. R2A3]